MNDAVKNVRSQISGRNINNPNKDLQKKSGCLKITLIILGSFIALVILSTCINEYALSEMSPDQRAAFEAERAAKHAAEQAEREREREAKVQAKLDEQKAAEQAELEKRNNGFHCLSEWDGSHFALNYAVKQSLRNPKSFEHIRTSITPVDDDGKHIIKMTYRAQNGFGGMSVESVMGWVNSSDCKIIIWGQ